MKFCKKLNFGAKANATFTEVTDTKTNSRNKTFLKQNKIRLTKQHFNFKQIWILMKPPKKFIKGMNRNKKKELKLHRNTTTMMMVLMKY